MAKTDKTKLKPTVDYSTGDTVLIRQVGSLYIGTIVADTPLRYRLAPAVWVRHIGNDYHGALQKGTVDQPEPIPADCLPLDVTKAPIQDMCRWPHAIPAKK